MASDSDLNADDARRDIDDLADGALVDFVGKTGRLARTLYMWIVAALFGAEILGEYSLAWGVVTTAGQIGRFGLQRGVPRFVVAARAGHGQQPGAATPEHALAAALWISVVGSLLVTFGLLAAAPYIARFYGDPAQTHAIRIMAWCVPLLSLATVFVESTYALRIVRFGVYVYSIGGPLILLLGGLAAAALDAGLAGLAWAQVGMAGGMGVLGAAYCLRYYSLTRLARALVDGGPWGAMVRFCVPVMLTDTVHALLMLLDLFVLGAYSSAERVGVYAAARRLSSVLLKVPQSFEPIFSPIVSELAARGQSARLRPRCAALIRWILTVDMPLVGAALLAGPTVLGVLGPEFVAGSAPLLVLSLAMVIQGVAAPAETIVILGGHPGLNLLTNIAWLAVALMANLLLIPPLGMGGAAMAVLAAAALAAAARLALLGRLHRVRPYGWDQGKPLAAAALAAALAWSITRPLPAVAWAQALAVVVFGAAYALALGALGLAPEDRALAARTLGRWRRRPQGPPA